VVQVASWSIPKRTTMNYFAHGVRYLDRPWFLAGTALPDWLSVLDRRVRLRSKVLLPFADGTFSPVAELAGGALQHFEDDHWFHKTRAFAESTGQLTHLFREFMGPGDNFRCGFLGHITTELILDAILVERFPDRLDTYYEVLRQLDGKLLTESVSVLAGQPVDLEPWLPKFDQAQFLRDYADPARLAFRLNQVLRRIKLEPLPPGIEVPLATARGVVEAYADGLLPPSRFVIPPAQQPNVMGPIEASA
jgi:hypothetical protein